MSSIHRQVERRVTSHTHTHTHTAQEVSWPVIFRYWLHFLGDYRALLKMVLLVLRPELWHCGHSQDRLQRALSTPCTCSMAWFFLNRPLSSVCYVQAWHYTCHIQFLMQSCQKPSGGHVVLQVRKLKVQGESIFPRFQSWKEIQIFLPLKTPALESL